jgi:hypothetical protein
MAAEYIARIEERHYAAFRQILKSILPKDYAMWLRVRERAKQRMSRKLAIAINEIDVSPKEFEAFCATLARPELNIYGLDRCARQKAHAEFDFLSDLVVDRSADGARRR